MTRTEFYGFLTQAIADGRYVQDAGTTTDNALARFDGTTGLLIQNSGVTLDDNNRINLPTHTSSTGGIAFGTDNNIYRAASRQLISTGNIAVLQANSTDFGFLARTDGDTINRFGARTDGQLEWGTGTAARDTNLYRSAANTLKTDDALVIGASGTAIQTVLSATAVLDFPSTLTGSISDLTVTVTGAAVGDVVALGVPGGSVTATATFFGWVSAADTVTIRFSHNSAGSEDPPSGTFRVMVTKF